MKTQLDQIEIRLKSFIESVAQLGPWSNRQDRLANQITSALQDSLGPGFENATAAPNKYTIILNPESAAFWKNHPELVINLAATLEDAALESGIHFSSPPEINLEGDMELGRDEVRIVVTQMESIGSTAVMKIIQDPVKESQDPRPTNAFLIINGEKNFPLRLAVINIGRRPDNQLVIEDPRVSRNHAQLRAAHGHFIIFDLNSTGGTFINGERIIQHVLQPGDVISLAGVPLIYGEDSTPVPPREDLSSGTIPFQTRSKD
jgi:hypothetical protein